LEVACGIPLTLRGVLKGSIGLDVIQRVLFVDRLCATELGFPYSSGDIADGRLSDKEHTRY
jgi:hypothetical protein